MPGTTTTSGPLTGSSPRIMYGTTPQIRPRVPEAPPFRAKVIMPDFRYTSFDAVLADEDLVAVRWTSRGTPVGWPAFMRGSVGKRGPMEITGVNTYRMRDGEVVEIWNNRDDRSIMREMGLFRWFVTVGFLAGVVVALLASWAVRRWRRSQNRTGEPAYT